MKITALLLALFVTSVGVAAKEFVPSHRLAAQLRFEAIRAGESYQDHTPPPATREEFIKQRDARTKARRDNLIEAYTQELKASQPKKSTEATLMERIEALEAKLLEKNEAKEESNDTSTTPQPEEPEQWNAIATSDGTLIAAGGAVACVSLAGLAGMGFMRRRKSDGETDIDLDNGFDS